MARTTLEALDRAESPYRVERVISLLDPASAGPPVPLPRGASWKSCGRSRSRFLRAVLGQAVSRPDFVLFDHVDLAQCQTLLPRFLRRPYGIWIHGIEVWKPLPRRKLAALRGASVLLANSDFTKRRFEEFHGRCPGLKVVPLTFAEGDGAAETPGSAEHGSAPIPPTEPWILTVGRMEPGRPKGHREILAALPTIVAAVPDVHWHVAGTGSAFEDFKQAVARSECRDHVTLHGFVETHALNFLFARSRVFCMPSEGEGFGVVYLEAMRRGCIPVGSLMDAAREVIGDGGRCVDHTDSAVLADELISLLTLPAEELTGTQVLARQRAEAFRPDVFSRNLFAALRAE